MKRRGKHEEKNSNSGFSEMPQPGEPLTPTEMKVLKLVAQDKTNEEIARDLMISKRTEATHVSSIIQKLGVKSRTGAVVEGYESGKLGAG